MIKIVLFDNVLFDCLLVNFCSLFKLNIWMLRQNLDCHCSFKQKEFFSSLEIWFSSNKLLELRLHHGILIFIKKGIFELLEKLICELEFELENICRWLLNCSCQFYQVILLEFRKICIQSLFRFFKRLNFRFENVDFIWIFLENWVF